jgi:transposase
MHPAAARYDVIRAREAGLDARQIERLTGVPPASQRRIAHEEIPFAMTDTELHQVRQVGRPGVLTPSLRQQIDTWLAEEPALKVAEILRRLTTDYHYRDGKNPVYGYVRQVRPPKAPRLPVVRFEGVAGEFAQHDFGTLTLAYLNGTAEKLGFYAGRLKYSRMLHVALFPGETAEAYIRGLEAAAWVWGGLPLFQVVDNTKATVLRRVPDPTTGEVRIRYNAHFATFLREVGVFAEPTAPYAAQQKGSVENLVGFVKDGFFRARRFRHRPDLEGQLPEWLHYVNAERPCDATGVIPAVRLREEQPRLYPLPFGEAGYGLAYPAVVGRDARVRCLGYAYSTPAGWIGQAVVARVHPRQVVLHYHDQRVVHPRLPSNGRYSLLPEHRAALFVKPRGRVMAQRQFLMDLSPEAEAFFTELVHRRPHTWRQQDLPVAWQLFEELGELRLQEALRYCLAQGAIGGEYLRAYAEAWAAEGAA